jgi:triosephosphate isomerase
MKPFIIANWKMNLTLGEAIIFIKELERDQKIYYKNLVIAPPLPYLSQLTQVSKIQFCAQDVSVFSEDGSYTGETSAKIIKSCGVNYSIIGHSERRSCFSENNEMVRIKIENCLKAGITPIVCFGETIDDRAKGNYQELLLNQIQNWLPQTAENIILAYEPLWSIGSGSPADGSDIMEIVHLIEGSFARRVAKNLNLVYGGSVTSKNYKDIVRVPGIDGILVGRAALDVKELIKMLNCT